MQPKKPRPKRGPKLDYGEPGFGSWEERDTPVDPNQLLNFSLPSIQRERGPAPRNTRKVVSHSLPFQKERFMQANYKFAVCPNIYDHVSFAYSHSRRVFDGTVENVDKILDNEIISQVVLTVNKPYQCVVCLGQPICPKISVCGHVFCWTCIVQYFASRIHDTPTIFSVGKQRCPCPVCQSILEINDFRPVQIVLQEKITVGNKVKFNLVHRDKTSTVVCLKSAEDSFQSATLQNLSSSKSSFIFTRFPALQSFHAPMNRVNVAFAQDIDLLWQKEELELEGQVKEALSSQDPASPLFILAQDLHNKLKEDFLRDENKYLDRPPERASSSPPKSTDKSQKVYFYQESGGEPVFLHPISVRWLLKDFEPDKLPPLMEGEVLLLEDEITQDESTRKRYRFLGHLPICCNFRFCLVDISPFLSPGNVTGFLEEVKALKKTIQTQAKEKRQHEQQLQRRYEEKYMKELATPVSQAVLYQKLTNPETVSNDSANFPLLPGGFDPTPVQSQPIPSKPPHAKWASPDGSSKLRQIIEKKSEQFPALSPTGPSPAPAQPAKPAQVWGASNHLRETKQPITIKQPHRPTNIVLNDHKY